MALDPASLPDKVDALERMVIGMSRDAVHANTLIEKLHRELARLKRVQFDVSSEKSASSSSNWPSRPWRLTRPSA